MSRSAVSAIMISFLVLSTLALAFKIQPVKAGIIVVPDDYPTIQEAINNANTGDTIFVRNGTYYENIVLNRSVALAGKDPFGAIIDGSGNGTVVSLEANSVAVSGLTIRDSGNSDYDCGIFVNSSRNNLTNDIVTSNYNGIMINPYSDDDTLINNSVNANNVYGIHLWYSNNSVLSGNIVTNGYDGLIIEECSNITMSNNTMSGNVWNFGLGGVALTDFVHNIDTSNKIEGKPIQYLLNKNGALVDSKWEVGYLCIVNSTNVTVKDLSLNTPSWNGVLFAYTTNSTIENVTISQTSYAIDLTHSSNNTVTNNDISNRNGIRLSYSDGNTICNNSILENDFAVSLFTSSDNTIMGNDIDNNWRGIFLYSSNNRIYHNNFINNGVQVYTDENVYSNTWDNGYPSGGNYWSDYNGTDIYIGPYQNETGRDGIGDVSYGIDANNVDHYPLMNPWTLPDIAASNLTSAKTVIGQGCTGSVNVTFENLGHKIEAFNATVYANSTCIHSEQIILAMTNCTLSFRWNTTGFVLGNYTISAYAWPVLDETYRADNNFTGGWVIVSLVGDITGSNGWPDGTVDSRDVGVVATHFGQTVPPAPSNCDVTGPAGVPDGKIDMRDIGLVARHIGNHHP